MIAAGLLSSNASAGTVRGTVKFQGDRPARQVLRVAGDKVCEALTAKNPPVLEEVVVNENSTLRNVVVYISKGWPDDAPKKSPGSRQTIVQQNCQFYPHVLAVQSGQEVEIQSRDETLHNVNILPKNNPRFNKTSFGKDSPALLKFEKPELAIKVKDDIHPWMVAWVAVFDHGDFAVTGEDGTFQIPDLPPGEYVINAWHEKFGQTETPVIVGQDGATDVVFNFTATGDKSGTQTQFQDKSTTIPE